MVACGARGGLRLTVSPLADGSPATRVPLSPLGDPHARLHWSAGLDLALSLDERDP